MTLTSKINVLIGSAGSPGGSTLVRYTKKYSNINRVFAYDADFEAVGRFFADHFKCVPKVTEDEGAFVASVLDYVTFNNIDILCVCSSLEVLILAKHAKDFKKVGCTVLVSDPGTLEVVNNKRRLYEECSKHDLCKVPDFLWFNTSAGFEKALERMSTTHNRLCVKPSVSKGKRGFRRLRETGPATLEDFFSSKPSDDTISVGQLVDMFRSVESFPEMLLMEEVGGDDVDTMALGSEAGDFIGATHKTRERDRGGVIDRGMLIGDHRLDVQSKNIIEHFKIKYLVGIQYKGGNIIEINPRFSSFIYSREWNDIWVLFDYVSGLTPLDEAQKLYSNRPVGLRMVRYFDQLSHLDSCVVG